MVINQSIILDIYCFVFSFLNSSPHGPIVSIPLFCYHIRFNIVECIIGIGVLLVPRFYHYHHIQGTKDLPCLPTHIYDINKDDYRELNWQYPFTIAKGDIGIQWIPYDQSLLIMATLPLSSYMSPQSAEIDIPSIPSGGRTTTSTSAPITSSSSSPKLRTGITNAYVLRVSSLMDRSQKGPIMQLPQTIEANQWLSLPNVIPHDIKYMRSVVQP
jgi:hypothetical protein